MQRIATLEHIDGGIPQPIGVRPAVDHDDALRALAFDVDVDAPDGKRAAHSSRDVIPAVSRRGRGTGRATARAAARRASMRAMRAASRPRSASMTSSWLTRRRSGSEGARGAAVSASAAARADSASKLSRERACAASAVRTSLNAVWMVFWYCATRCALARASPGRCAPRRRPPAKIGCVTRRRAARRSPAR